jgi:hypothetical protein
MCIKSLWWKRWNKTGYWILDAGYWLGGGNLRLQISDLRFL